MNKTIIILCIVFAPAMAQNTYVGIGGSLLFMPDVGAFPLPSIQVGGEIADTVELRATLDSLIFASLIGVDALFTDSLPDTKARFYLGGGVTAFIFTLGQFSGSAFGLRTPLGLEFYTMPEQQFGIYAEALPMLFFARDTSFLATLRAGLNFHF
jgi:hypothetical protein